MFPAVAAVAGVGVCAQAIGNHLCKVTSPVLHEFWEAALHGNSAGVGYLISKHAISPDTRHHISDASLVIEIADRKVSSEALDLGLAGVLRTLAQVGWSLTVRRRVTHENGLHLLACQPRHHHIGHRLRVLLEAELTLPRRDSMLAQQDWVAHLPEHKAPATGDKRELRKHLAAARQATLRNERLQQREEGLRACWEATLRSQPVAAHGLRGNIAVAASAVVVTSGAVQVQRRVSAAGEQVQITIAG